LKKACSPPSDKILTSGSMASIMVDSARKSNE
jgi:hypothetical protein